MTNKKNIPTKVETDERKELAKQPLRVKAHPAGGIAPVDEEHHLEQIRATFGTNNVKTAQHMLNQLLAVIPDDWNPGGEAPLVNAVTPLLAGIGPQDELEGMLAIQIVGIHHLAMASIRRASSSGQYFGHRIQNVNEAVRLTKLFSEQVAALDKHRGHAGQKVVVEHITVEKGGQAAVGNFNSKDGGSDEK